LPKNFGLATIGGIMVELKRAYRMAHHGEMAWSDACSAARVLRELRFCLEGGDLEARIAALEADQPAGARPNGHHSYQRPPH
jgi:hypothetical protein